MSTELSAAEAETAIASFQSIIRYPTVSSTAPSTGAYVDCAQYLLSQLKSVPCLDSIGILDESPDKSPVVIAKWRGIHEDWPVIILNSHYDVVPAAPEDWTVDPFAATRKDGKVYGRGAQDMKCVCLHGSASYAKIGILREAEDGGGEVAGGGCGRQARGGGRRRGRRGGWMR